MCRVARFNINRILGRRLRAVANSLGERVNACDSPIIIWCVRESVGRVLVRQPPIIHHPNVRATHVNVSWPSCRRAVSSRVWVERSHHRPSTVNAQQPGASGPTATNRTRRASRVRNTTTLRHIDDNAITTISPDTTPNQFRKRNKNIAAPQSRQNAGRTQRSGGAAEHISGEHHTSIEFAT